MDKRTVAHLITIAYPDYARRWVLGVARHPDGMGHERIVDWGTASRKRRRF